LNQADLIETQRNVRTVKKLYGQDQKEKVLEKHDDQVEFGGVAGMTKLIEPTRVTNIIKENRELI